jgi:hypothetical protein
VSFLERNTVVVVNPEIQHVVSNHAKHHAFAKHTRLAKHAAHSNVPQRRQLIAEEAGEFGGGHGIFETWREATWTKKSTRRCLFISSHSIGCFS